MMRRWLVVAVLLAMVSGALARETFVPRDDREAEAWKIYSRYKQSTQSIRRLEARIEGIKRDILMVKAPGYIGDAEDRADLTRANQELEAAQKRQQGALAAWGSDFYWRYGDLHWADQAEYGVARDRSHGEMDHIQYAIVNFPFNPGGARPVPPPDPRGNATTSNKLELPGYWGHLSYTIQGARLNPPTGSDRGNVGGRQYQGVLTGDTLSITFNGISDNESSGPGSGDYYELTASVTVGSKTRTYAYIAPKGEKLSKSGVLSVPITPGKTGSFHITLMEQNRNYGPHGWVVSGTMSPRQGAATSAGSGSPSAPAGTSGHAISRDGRTWEPVTPKTRLSSGSQVKTGPGQTITLHLGSAIDVVLNRSTWLVASSVGSPAVAVQLKDGHVRVSSPRLGAGRSLTVATSLAAIRMTGTDFEVWENGSRTAVRVNRGSVDVRNRATDATLRVRAGQTCMVTSDGASCFSRSPVTVVPEERRKHGVTSGDQTVRHPTVPSSSRPGPLPETFLINTKTLAAVKNGPTTPTTFAVDGPTLLTSVLTYHWYDGRGAAAGQISLRHHDGTVYGPWNATLVSRVYWVVNFQQPGLMQGPLATVTPSPACPLLKAGRYTVVDSSPATWSQNAETSGMGITIVKGVVAPLGGR